MFGLPCPTAVRQALDVPVALASASLTTAGQVLSGVREGGRRTLDLATFGTVSFATDSLATFLVEDGTVQERSALAFRAGQDAQLDSVTFGFYSAEDRAEHAKQLISNAFAADQFEIGTQNLVNGIFEGDLDLATRGGAQLLGASSQVVLTVAGASRTGGTANHVRPRGPVGKVEALSSGSTTNSLAQVKKSVPARSTVRDRVLENIRESAAARAARNQARVSNRVRQNIHESRSARVARINAQTRNRVKANVAESTNARAARGATQTGSRQRLNVNSAGRETPAAPVEVRFNIRGNPAEFRRQLTGQERGLNRLKAGEVRENIERFRQEGRPKEASAAIRRFRRQNPELARGKAVLHNPDCCIGGRPDLLDDVGDIFENGVLGSQNRVRQSLVFDVVRDLPPDVFVNFRFIAE